MNQIRPTKDQLTAIFLERQNPQPYTGPSADERLMTLYSGEKPRPKIHYNADEESPEQRLEKIYREQVVK